MSIRRAQDERIEGNPDGLNAITEIPDVPDAPTISAADVGTSRPYNNGAATVTLTAAATGGTPTSYNVTSSPGSFTGSGTSPVTVTGLQAGTSYTFTATGTNSTATGPVSSASGPITATTVPQAPTIGTATLSGTSASVTFTGNASGGSSITSYTATSSPGSITASNSSSPITVPGLSGSTTYTFTVTATNANGTSAASGPSNSITTSRYSNVGWWDLNTYSSVTLTDLSGNGYDGTYNSAANGYFTSQTYNGYVGRGISGKAATPCFTISKAYNLTECTIIAIGTFGGANNGKYAFLCSNSGLTDNLTFTMDAGGGDAGHPYIYGNGGYAVTSNAHGSGYVRMYSTVIPSSTSQVTLPKIKINAQDVALREYGLPPSTITHTIGSLMRIDEYNGIGSAVWWEIKVFDKALTATELSNEEAYFKTKWGF